MEGPAPRGPPLRAPRQPGPFAASCSNLCGHGPPPLGAARARQHHVGFVLSSDASDSLRSVYAVRAFSARILVDASRRAGTVDPVNRLERVWLRHAASLASPRTPPGLVLCVTRCATGDSAARIEGAQAGRTRPECGEQDRGDEMQAPRSGPTDASGCLTVSSAIFPPNPRFPVAAFWRFTFYSVVPNHRSYLMSMGMAAT